MSSHSLIDISHGKPDFILFLDASLTGWGCSSEHGRTGGHWDSTEVAVSINALELKAGLFALQVFVSDKCSLHLRLMKDNTTAVICVNKMGTRYLPVSQSKSGNSERLEIYGFQQLVCLV